MSRRLARGVLMAAATLPVITACGEDEASSSGSILDPSNHPPQLEAVDDTSVAVGDTLFLQARASDVDGHTIRYETAIEVTWEEIRLGLYPDVTMDEQTGEWEFRPNSRDIPGRDCHFIADDQHGGRDTTSFHVEVQ